MKKTITAGVAALALTLTACGEDNTDTTAPTAANVPPQADIPAPSPAPTTVEEAELGETITLVEDVAGPRTAHLTIDEITVSESCHHGEEWPEMLPDDGYYIQMVGEMESVEGERGFSFNEMWMTGTTEDGYAVELSSASGCVRPDLDGHQDFDSTVIAGQKALGVSEFWASDLPETLTLTLPYEPVDYVWTVPAP